MADADAGAEAEVRDPSADVSVVTRFLLFCGITRPLGAFHRWAKRESLVAADDRASVFAPELSARSASAMLVVWSAELAAVRALRSSRPSLGGFGVRWSPSGCKLWTHDLYVAHVVHNERGWSIGVASRWIPLTRLRAIALSVAAVCFLALWLYASLASLWSQSKARHTSLWRIVWCLACHISTMPFVLPVFVFARLHYGLYTSQLLRASARGCVDIVRPLIKLGANVNAADEDGKTALICASHEGHFEVVRLLIERGADVNIVSDEGWTALICASHEGHVEVVRLLIERGADVNVVSDEGWTALIRASYRGHVKVVRLLIERGADVNVVSDEGWAALDIASIIGHVGIVRLLRDAGGDGPAAHLHELADLVHEHGQRLPEDAYVRLNAALQRLWRATR